MAVSDKDLLAEALDRIVEQLKNKPNYAALVSAYTAQSSALQAALLQILDDTSIDNSEGAQLDGLGRIVGEARNGRDDPAYRTALKVRIRVNLSEGTLEEIVAIIVLAIGGGTVEITEYQPAAFIARVLTPIDPDVVSPSQVGELVRQARGAGIGSGTVFHVANPFQYDTGFGYDEGAYADIF